MSNDYGGFYGMWSDLTDEDMAFFDKLHEENNEMFSVVEEVVDYAGT